MTIHWKELYRSATDPVALAVETIDSANGQLCLVVDDDEHLLGTVTDGDVRRGILRGLPLDAPVSEIMKKEPVVGRPGQSNADIKASMITRQIRQLPIVDLEGHVIGLNLLDELDKSELDQSRENLVVLMAGGDGVRLRPLTDDLPKPLLKVGDKPILERILESFLDHHFQNFAISVNYKSEMIKKHFGDGSKWGVSIQYLEEAQKLGTAGPLSLLQKEIDAPIIVMNGDVLTQVNFDSLLAFHNEQNAKAMMCVRNYDFQIPYGVVKTNNMRVTAIDEKPKHQFFVNAGIYVLEPDILSMIPVDTYFEMPDLFRTLIEQERTRPCSPFVNTGWISVRWTTINKPTKTLIPS